MSIDELMEKYRRNDVDNVKTNTDDESMEEEEIEDSEDEAMEIDSDDQSEESIDENKQPENVGLKNLLDYQQSPTADSSCDNGDVLLNNVAALAQSIQPKGNTLSSTSVVTPIPFLLKHALREYQHIGLDWLVTMHDRKLNGILADEMGNYLRKLAIKSRLFTLFFFLFRSWKDNSNNCFTCSFSMCQRKLGTTFDCCSIFSDVKLGDGV